MGECRDFAPLVARAFEPNPDILVTHAPPGGVLDGWEGYGIPALASALFYQGHKITHHLFGHEHSCGGKMVVKGGITFSNAACHLNIIEVP